MKKTAKKLLSLLLVLSMLLSLASVGVMAADEGGGTDGGGTSGAGGGATVSVTLALGNGESADGVTMPENQSVPEGTTISELSYPEKSGYIFKGWYYDADCTEYAFPNDVIEDNTTLYAAFASRKVASVDENSDFVASMDQYDPNFTFVITKNAPSYTDMEQDYLTIMGIDTGDDVPDWDPYLIAQYVILKNQYTDTRMAMTVTENGDGTFNITAADGFEPGELYQLDLSAAKGLYHVYQGKTQLGTVVYHNMSVYQKEVSNFALENDIIYLSIDDVEDIGELAPLLTAEVVDLSEAPAVLGVLEEANKAGEDYVVETKNTDELREGTFVYKAPNDMLPKIGDMVCIYNGESPEDADYGVDHFTTEDQSMFVIIDDITDRYTFHYHTADAADVIDTPIVIPMDVAADLNANDGNRITLREDYFTFDPNDGVPFTMDGEIATYAEMGLNERSKVEVGDYLAFYHVVNGNVSGADIASPRLVRITGMSYRTVTTDAGYEAQCVIVNYVSATVEELQSRLKVHASEEYVVDDEFIDEHRDEVTLLAQRQFEEADKTPLLLGVLESEQVVEALGEYGLDLSEDFFMSEDGQLLNAELLGYEYATMDINDETTMAELMDEYGNSKITVRLVGLKNTPSFYNNLKHFNGRTGIGFNSKIAGKLEIIMDSFTFLRGDEKEGKGKIVIEFETDFSQEIWINTDFDADIEWKGSSSPSVS